jgi:hypothetical protein
LGAGELSAQIEISSLTSGHQARDHRERVLVEDVFVGIKLAGDRCASAIQFGFGGTWRAS